MQLPLLRTDKINIITCKQKISLIKIIFCQKQCCKYSNSGMKYLLYIIFLVFAGPAMGTNYYVNPSGLNTNSGLSPSAPFGTLQFAANIAVAGDTVCAMGGTYTDTTYGDIVMNVYNSGTPGNYIVFKNYPGQLPVIQLYNQWGGIQLQGADYIVIDSFMIIGNNDAITLAYAQAYEDSTNNPATSGNGIGIAMQYGNPANKPHHDIIRNCSVTRCGGGGIYTYNADYITIDHCIVSDCGWYSPYANSGISMDQNWNSDSSVTIKNYINGNICYGNQNFIPFYVAGVITDGNGIILDDSRNTQNGSVLGPYVGRTYIANNVVFANGGRGIHAYSSDKAIIVNNTCYQNCQSPYVHDGELTAIQTDSVYFINNISSPATGIPPVDTSQSANTYVDHNFWAANAVAAVPAGTNTISGPADFINPSLDPASANFDISAGSAAIHAGTSFYAPAADILGHVRPITDSVDIGAYQYQLPSEVFMPGNSIQVSVYPNPAMSTIWVAIQSELGDTIAIVIYDIKGIKALAVKNTVTTKNIPVNIETLSEGWYFAMIYENGRAAGVGRFYKEHP